MYLSEPTGWQGAGTVSGGTRIKKQCVHAVCHVRMGEQSGGSYSSECQYFSSGCCQLGLQMYMNEPTGWRGAGTVSGETRVKKQCAHAVCHVHMGEQSGGSYSSECQYLS